MPVPLTELFIAVTADTSEAIAALTALGAEVDATAAQLSAAQPAGLALAAIGAALDDALVQATQAAVDFDQMIVQVRNNTTETDADMESMRQTILDLGNDAPVALDNLAQGYMHVTNFGFDAANATLILDAAMKSAVSTGADTSKTAELLAAILHEFGLAGSDAARVMDELHLASALGNQTLEQFVSTGGRVFAWAAAVGVPFDQAAAALATMTRNGFNASQAVTQVQDVFEHIIHPSAAAEKALADLSARSGTDLSNALSASNLQSRGLTGVIDQLHDAMLRANLSAADQTAEWLRLIPNIRGGAAAFILSGRGAQDFATILDQMRNGLGVTDAAFQRMSETAGFQWGVLTNQFQEMAIAVGNILQPALVSVIGWLRGIVAAFQTAPPAVQAFITYSTAAAAIVSTLLGAFLILAPAIIAVGPAFGLLAGALASLVPVFLVAAGLFATLKAAWDFDLAGIQGIVAAGLGQLPGVLAGVGDAFARAATFWSDTLEPGIASVEGAILERLIPAFNQLASNPIVESFASGIAQIFSGDLRGAIDTFASTIASLIPAAAPIFSALGDVIGGVLANVLPILGNLGFALSRLFSGDIGGAADTFRATLVALVPALGPVMTAIDRLGTFVAGLMPTLGNFGFAISRLFSGDVSGAADTFRATLVALVPALGPVFALVDSLSGLLATRLGPSFESIGAFISGSLAPRLGDLAGGVFPALQTASQLLADVWETRLSPALQSVGDFIANQIVPRLGPFVDSLLPGLLAASAAVADFWNGTFAPALANVGGFIDTQVAPAFARLWATMQDAATVVSTSLGPPLQALGDTVMPTLQGAVAALADTWTTSLQPALEAAGGVLAAEIGPAFENLRNLFATLLPGGDSAPFLVFLRDQLPGALSAFGAQVASLEPLFGSIAGFLGAVYNVLSAINDVAASALAGLFENVLVPGIQSLLNVLGPFANTVTPLAGALAPMATDLGLIGDALKPLTDFFNNATTALNNFADAIRNFPVPDLLRPGSGARIPGLEGTPTRTTGFTPGAEGAGGGLGIFGGNAANGPLVSIGQIIVSNEAEGIALAQQIADAINRSARRVTPPGSNTQTGLIAV